MTGAAVALAAGSLIYAAFTGLAAWPMAIGTAAAILTRDPFVLVSGVAVGLAFGQYWRAAEYARSRDGDQQTALVFVVRLRQMLAVRGSLAGALDSMGYRSEWIGSDAGERVLNRVAKASRVEALTFLARVASAVRRHGGSLLPVVDWSAEAIQEAQGLRQTRQLEEAAQRTTIVTLALAPWGVAFLFRALIPAFFHTLTHTRIGNTAVLAVGLTTYGVFWLLVRHIRGEAESR